MNSPPTPASPPLWQDGKEGRARPCHGFAQSRAARGAADRVEQGAGGLAAKSQAQAVWCRACWCTPWDTQLQRQAATDLNIHSAAVNIVHRQEAHSAEIGPFCTLARCPAATCCLTGAEAGARGLRLRCACSVARTGAPFCGLPPFPKTPEPPHPHTPRPRRPRPVPPPQAPNRQVLYEQQKREKAALKQRLAQQRAADAKEVRIGCSIAEHDLGVKMAQVCAATAPRIGTIRELKAFGSASFPHGRQRMCRRNATLVTLAVGHLPPSVHQRRVARRAGTAAAEHPSPVRLPPLPSRRGASWRMVTACAW